MSKLEIYPKSWEKNNANEAMTRPKLNPSFWPIPDFAKQHVSDPGHWSLVPSYEAHGTSPRSFPPHDQPESTLRLAMHHPGCHFLPCCVASININQRCVESVWLIPSYHSSSRWPAIRNKYLCHLGWPSHGTMCIPWPSVRPRLCDCSYGCHVAWWNLIELRCNSIMWAQAC